ncbi:PREDICTED: leukotriene C4 synthase-like isoform X1 [Calidris pugnax]|uniref:leukotriene C4 synthase-like isoform X1 n=1 Tax=Calidris pugnax TaxID=198806 RepID=UPI00071D1A99|nr:PREDICTED: leukotriene C4 synthase-like isoform X1 [Calidris pugnax]
MRNQIDLLATVTVLGVLEQAYFTLQVIYARRKYKISPPATTGHPEFERIFRAQVNCSEYFPIFISLLWVAGIFFHQGVAAACGLLYLYMRFKYFQGYTTAAQERLVPSWGCGHPKPTRGGWVQDVSPGAGLLPVGGTGGRLASPPSPPLLAPPAFPQ